MSLTFLFADMGAEIYLVETTKTGIRRVVARCLNPLWEKYCQEWTRTHPGSVPCKHGGTMMQMAIPQ